MKTSRTPLRVVHVAAEIYPLIKTGGLGDVVAALPPALAALGIDTRILLPGYPAILDGVTGLRPVLAMGPAFGAARVSLLQGRLPGSDLVCYVIDAPFLYRRAGNPYVDEHGLDWRDNHRRFALLGWVAAQLAAGGIDADWTPDIVHAHDWHAGLAAAYLAQHPAARTGTVFTIHNLAFRGLFDFDAYPEMGLPSGKLTPQGLEFHGQFSFLKAGLVYSSRLTTVSPSYAREICTAEFGFGLDGVLREHRGKLSGILNGIDTQIWNPETDPVLAAHFRPADLSGKTACKRALQAEYGLGDAPRAPLFVIVSRLTPQKGLDLVLAALPELIAAGGQLVVLGTGSAEIEAAWRAAASAHPQSVAVHIGYDEAASHHLIAGADVLLVPSRFEPCGLTQLYALRYGTLPLVRQVGGLADTVVDSQPETLRAGTATGFAFHDASATALGQRLQDVCRFYQEGAGWRRVQQTGMAADFSWNKAAEEYRALYEGLVR